MLRMQLVAAVLAAGGLVGAPGSVYGSEALQDETRGQGDPVAEAASDAHRAWVGETMVRLADIGGAREMALAALLRPLVEIRGDGDAAVAVGPEVLEWTRRASAMAGGDHVANHLLVGGISTGDNVEQAGLRRAAAARWRAAEPDNLAPLLYSDLPPEQLVAAAANARRYDLHYVEMIRAVARMLAAHPPTAAMRAALSAHAHSSGGTPPLDAGEHALLYAAGLAAAFANPGLQPLTEACSLEAVDADESRRVDCVVVARVMRTASDTELGEDVGRALARRLASPAELRTIAAETRLRAWRREQMATATAGDAARDLHRYYADPGLVTEQALAERVIGDAGLSLLPPADWKPRQAN